MLWWFAQTTLIAGALAILATLASRWKRLGAEVRHALWLIVLIKLAIPPIVAWPWRVPDRWPSRVEQAPATLPSLPVVVAEVAPPVPLPLPVPPPQIEMPPFEIPRAEPSPAPRVEVEPPGPLSVPPSPEEVLAGTPPVSESQIPEIPNPRSLESRAEVHAPLPPMPEIAAPEVEIAPRKSAIRGRESATWNPQSLILSIWLIGSLIVIVRRGIKIVRFQRSLSRTSPAPDWLIEETRAIGERIGVRPPPVVTTSNVVTPLLWCLGRPRLILPEALVKRLEADQWPGILAHELAHLARRDHWVVRLELLVEAVWWWNPLFRHARRKLHEEAELACDARVVRSLPERRFAYAEALVDVCEHLARSAIPAPSLGVGGAGASRSLEGRLLMILRDPIPRRPSRMAVLGATFLAALALPAWSLGRQKSDEPKPKVEAPPTAGSADTTPSKPDEPKAGTPQPLPPDTKPSQEAAEATIDTIKEAQDERFKGLDHLSFRYIVVSREQNSRQIFGMNGGGGMGGMGRGMGGMGGMMSMPIQDPGGFGPADAASVSRRVGVEVADVVLNNGQASRLDYLKARSAEPLAPNPNGFLIPPEDPIYHWDRRFVARDRSGIMAIELAWDSKGAVPFRWLAAGQERVAGDSLFEAMIGSQPMNNKDKGLEPLDPRPANMLGLLGSSICFVNRTYAQAEVAGIDMIDGQEVVRVAWIGNQWGLRGICWFAPKLDFALVRSDATRDPYPNSSQGRLTWRRQASEFVKVGGYWLPGKVSYEESQANPDGGEPDYRNELKVAFEDFNLDQNPPAAAVRPKPAIQGLDDKTGQFTALPPELPAGLVQRLEQAVRESPFGPPAVEEKTVEPPAPQAPAGQQQLLQPGPGGPGQMLGQPGLGGPGQVPGQQLFPAPLQPNGAIIPGPGLAPPAKDAAKADPGIIAPPKLGFEDPLPVAQPRNDDPIPVKDPGDQAMFDRMLERKLKTDSEVLALDEQIRTAQYQYNKALGIARSPDDPAVRASEKKLDQLQKKHEQLLMTKSQTYQKEALELAPILQARRDGKAAELQKAEAQKKVAQAVVARNEALVKKNLSYVSREDIVRAEGELAVADAEVGIRKADLDEAEIRLGQAKQSVSPSNPASKVVDRSGVPSSSTLPELRDAVELMQVQLLGKQTELRGAESKSDLANKQWQRLKELVTRNAAVQGLENEAEDQFKVTRAEVEQKKVEVQEYEIRLKQAIRRVEFEEARLKREIDRAKARLDWSEGLFKKEMISSKTVEADRAAYEELMFQLDPKYVPAATEPKK